MIPADTLDQIVDAVADRLYEKLADRFDERAPDGSSPWMRTDEAIEYSRIKEGTFRKLVASGQIRSHGVGTKTFHKAELDEDLGYSAPIQNVTELRRPDAA